MSGMFVTIKNTVIHYSEKNVTTLAFLGNKCLVLSFSHAHFMCVVIPGGQEP